MLKATILLGSFILQMDKLRHREVSQSPKPYGKHQLESAFKSKLFNPIKLSYTHKT